MLGRTDRRRVATSMSSSGKLVKDPKFASVSVYHRIEEDLRSRVKAGYWPVGAMLPSRKNLAKEYGVDERTIQRAIAGLLSDGTLRADGGRGTFVTDAAARSGATVAPARSTLTKMVAIVLDQRPPPTYPSAQAVLRAFHQTFHAQAPDYRLVTLGVYGDTPEQAVELERHALDVIETEGIAGAVICHSGSPSTLAQISRMIENGVPVVYLDRCPTTIACDYVGIDNTGGAQEAVDYLVSLGHERIAHLTTTATISTIEQRLTGYQKALKTAGLPIDPDLLWRIQYWGGWRRDVRRAIDHFRSLAVPPTAVFVASDDIAQVFVAEATACGWSVPDDVSVVGFDDIEQFSPLTPFLTTVQQPFELTGSRAAELLLRNLETPKEAARTFQQVLLPSKLMIRASSRRL